MYATDFLYDEQLASSYGLAICHISSEKQSDISMGSEIEFETVRHNGSQTNVSISSKYPNVLSISFDVAKINCENEYDYEFSEYEIEYIMKWLNRKEYLKLQFKYDNYEFSNVYYFGSFTSIKAIHIQGKVVGFSLTFTANADYGFSDLEIDYDISANQQIPIFVESSENGVFYPQEVQITINELNSDKKLIIENTYNEKQIFKCIINNCSDNEVLTFNSYYKTISSSITHQRLYNDYNFDWFRLVSDTYMLSNNIKINVPCNIKLKCSIPRKVGAFL